MEKSVRSALGAKLQTAQKFGKPITIEPNSTLNQKFGVATDMTPDVGDNVFVKYLGVGIGGHRSEVGTNNRVKFVSIPHQPQDTALYDQIPFLMRPIDDDLTPGERIKYRLRSVITVNGVKYAAYFLRVLDLSETVPSLEFRTVNNGVITSTPWVPTLANLNPVKPLLNPNQVMTTGDDYIAASARIPVSFTASDATELLNVGNILFGDPGYIVISEVCLCSGIDKVITGDFNGTPVGYTEAIGVQINDFLSTFFAPEFQSQGMQFNMDAGSIEPLLVLK